MTTLAVAVLFAAIALGLARVSRLPVGPVAIVAGIFLGFVPGVDPELVRDGLLLSATFLVFSMGAEIDRGDVAAHRGASITAAALFLGSTALVALGVWAFLDLERWTVVYLFLALGSSSTLVVVELLRRRERFFEPVGRFVTGVVLAQDSTVIVLLSLLGPLSAAGLLGNTEPFAASELVRPLLGALVIGLGGLVTHRWLAPAVLLRSRASEEEQLLFLLALLFAFGGVADFAGLPPVLGAYVAGVSLSRFPVGGLTRGALLSFSDFFTVLFFVLLGAVLEVPAAQELGVEVTFVVAVLVVRPALLFPVARRAGMTVRASVEAIHLLSQTGEIGLIVVLVGLQRGHVDAGLLSMVGLLVVLTTSLSPWLSSDANVARFTHNIPLRRSTRPTERYRGHVVVVGCGESGRHLVERLRALGTPLVVVEDDPEIVRQLDVQGVSVLRGDGGDPEVLRRAGANTAAAIVSTMRRLPDNARLLATFRGAQVLVRVFSGEQAAEVRRLGGVPVVEAELATGAALRWFEDNQENAAAGRPSRSPPAVGGSAGGSGSHRGHADPRDPGGSGA
jgi:CPA2 family monovalent cation:H+ antiporter-2